MTFPMPHPVCFSTVSPESEAADRAYDAYRAALPKPVAKAITEAYNSYGGRQDISNQQMADELSALEISLMASYQAKEAPKLAKAAQAEQEAQAKEQATQARNAFYANLANVDPMRRAVFVGQNIKAARIAAGLKQSDLAAALGASQALISQYEVGTMPVPPARLDRLAALFGKPVSEFTLPRGYKPDNQGKIHKFSTVETETGWAVKWQPVEKVSYPKP